MKPTIFEDFLHYDCSVLGKLVGIFCSGCIKKEFALTCLTTLVRFGNVYFLILDLCDDISFDLLLACIILIRHIIIQKHENTVIQ